MVEADAGEADLGLGLAAGFGDDDDGWPGRTTSPAYSAKRPSSPTLIDPRRWPDANTSGARASITTAPSGLVLQRDGKVERGRLVVVVEQLAFASVGVGGEREVQRGDGLAFGDGLDELVLGHRGEGVVGAPLLTDRGRRRRRQVLAAGRTGPVGRVDPGGVGQA